MDAVLSDARELKLSANVVGAAGYRRSDRWGWLCFDANNAQKTTFTDYKTNFQSCNVPAQNSDWIYTNGYRF